MIEMIRDRKERTSLINDDDLNHAWDYGSISYVIHIMLPVQILVVDTVPRSTIDRSIKDIFTYFIV